MDNGNYTNDLQNQVRDLQRELDELKKSCGRYRTDVDNMTRCVLFEENPLMLFVLDETGIVRAVNRRGAEQLGYDARELIGLSVLNVFYEDDRSAAVDHVKESFANPKKTLSWELRKVRKDGTIIWVKEYAKPFALNDGEIRIYVSCEDITEAKRLQDAVLVSEERLELALRGARAGVWETDLDTGQNIWDKGMPELLGISVERAQAESDHWINFIHPEDRDRVINSFQSASREGKPWSADFRVLRPDGGTYWLRSRGNVVSVSGNRRKMVGIAFDITRRKYNEARLEYQANLLSQVHDAIIALDEHFKITYWGQTAEEIFGWTEGEVIGKYSSDIFQPNLPEESIKAGIKRLIQTGYVEGEVHYRHKAGHYIVVHVRSASIKGQKDEFKGLVASMRDITRRKQMEDRLSKAKKLSDELNRINMLVHSSLDTRSVMSSALEGAQEVLQVDSAAVGIFEGGTLKEFSVRYYRHVPDEFREICCSPAQAKGIQYIAQRRDAFAFNDLSSDDRVNGIFWLGFGFRSMLAAPLIVRNQVVGAIMFFRSKPSTFDDLQIDFGRKMAVSLSLAFENATLYEQRGKMEEEMRHMAHHDPLTGLPNRRLFLDIIDLERKQSDRNRKKMAVLFLDLDRFKEINDTLGHDTGNLLLKEVANRLQSQIRRSDTIARIGGDEFNIILADVVEPVNTGDIARNILASFRKPFQINGQELSITTSIGISIYPDDSDNIDTLLRFADIAMYHAKERGRNGYQFYNSSINVKTLEHMRLEAMLRRSLELNEMEMWYQPIVDIRTNRIVCTEALARWRHPERGLLQPQEFIAPAEETGFINELGEWALLAICRQIRAWSKAGISPVRVSVNLSARQFQDAELVNKISAILKETGIPPSLLGIEITETIAMSDVLRSAERMKELQSMRIEVCVDDFGTGYSSLNYLKRLPIERLKIDKSFVQDIASDSDDRSIVKAVTAMAHSMRMRVVAEGVETEEQLDFLSVTGCDEMQGFLFSKPLSADAFEAMLKAA